MPTTCQYQPFRGVKHIVTCVKCGGQGSIRLPCGHFVCEGCWEFGQETTSDQINCNTCDGDNPCCTFGGYGGLGQSDGVLLGPVWKGDRVSLITTLPLEIWQALVAKAHHEPYFSLQTGESPIYLFVSKAEAFSPSPVITLVKENVESRWCCKPLGSLEIARQGYLAYELEEA